MFGDAFKKILLILMVAMLLIGVGLGVVFALPALSGRAEPSPEPTVTPEQTPTPAPSDTPEPTATAEMAPSTRPRSASGVRP